MLFTLRLVRFFPTSCSPHGLVLTSNPTFNKHELLFVLSSIFKNIATLRFHVFVQLIIRDRLIFITQILQPDTNRRLKFVLSKVTGYWVPKVRLNAEWLH